MITEERINEFFKQTEDADVYICGCGCKQQFDFVHGFAERIRIELLKHLKGENKDDK